jgi:hypothetical protein
MKHKLFLTFILFYLQLAVAQNVQELRLTLEKIVPLAADSFYGVDETGTLFYSTNNVFYKKTSMQTLEFYDILLGEITSVDLINPMNILLFYKESQMVVFIDNRLNETQRINLNELEPYKFIQHASIAGEQQLWLFNVDEQRLERYDYGNNRFLPFLKSVALPVLTMVSTYNFCHLKTAKQLLTFNGYGSLTNTIRLEDIERVATSFKQLAVLTKTALAIWQQDKDAGFSCTHRTEKLPDTLFNGQNTSNSLYLKGGKLYIYNRNRISVYNTNLLDK